MTCGSDSTVSRTAALQADGRRSAQDLDDCDGFNRVQHVSDPIRLGWRGALTIVRGEIRQPLSVGVGPSGRSGTHLI